MLNKKILVNYVYVLEISLCVVFFFYYCVRLIVGVFCNAGDVVEMEVVFLDFFM